MTALDIFLIGVCLLCGTAGVYSVLEARVDKTDPLNGQRIAAAIWEFTFAAICLLKLVIR